MTTHMHTLPLRRLGYPEHSGRLAGGKFVLCLRIGLWWVRWVNIPWLNGLPSGKRLQNYGKSPFLMGKLTINGYFQ